MSRHCNGFGRSPRLLSLLLAMLALTFTSSGCGKKTFPKPVSPEPPPQVTDLQVRIMPHGVELTWGIPRGLKADAEEKTLHFTVLRSELTWDKRNCLDCPALDQQELQRIDPRAPGAASIDGKHITWTDGKISVHHAYRYQVALQDGKRRTVSLSNPALAKVMSSPGAMRGVEAATDRQGILLRWKGPRKDTAGKPLQGEVQYLVERHSPTGTWEKVSPVPVKGDSFLDPAVAATQSYDYRVTPVLIFEETLIHGEPALVQHAKAPSALPPPPPVTVWVIPAKGVLEIQWTESEGKVAGYHVYRKEGKEIIRLTATPVQKPPYVDKAVKQNVIYSYAVSAISTQPGAKEGLLSKWAEIRSLSFE